MAVELLRQHFREATGQAQEDEWNQRRSEYTGIRRMFARITEGEKFDRAWLDWRREQTGHDWLAANIGALGNADLPLEDLVFVTDRVRGKTEFRYRALFDGSRIDEERQVRIYKSPQTIELKRAEGRQGVLSVIGGGEVIQWPRGDRHYN